MNAIEIHVTLSPLVANILAAGVGLSLGVHAGWVLWRFGKWVRAQERMRTFRIRG